MKEVIKRGAMRTILGGLLSALSTPLAFLGATDLIDSKWQLAIDRCCLHLLFLFSIQVLFWLYLVLHHCLVKMDLFCWVRTGLWDLFLCKWTGQGKLANFLPQSYFKVVKAAGNYFYAEPVFPSSSKTIFRLL